MIIIALDGMDYEEMKDMSLPNIKGNQEEFGQIGLSEMSKRVTSECFVSFITGENYEKHGCTGLRRTEYGGRIKFFEEAIEGTYLDKKTSALRKSIYKSVNSIEFREFIYTREDYSQTTIFDETGGKALYVPGYNPEMEWASEFPSSALENGFSVQDTYEKAWELTEKRIDDFWGLNFDFWPLVMLHLHQPDYSHHHLDEIDKEDYQRLDEFAGKVLDRFGEDRTILFMSDHGFPDDDAHNKNAFYSCNRAIFGDKTPQITDFHDKIIELVEE